MFFGACFLVLKKDNPLFGAKIQLSELLFVPFSLSVFLIFLKRQLLINALKLDYAVIAFVTLYLFNCTIHGGSIMIFEMLGIFYWLAIYFMLPLCFQQINLDIAQLKQVFYGLVLVLSSTGLIGLFLTQIGLETTLAWSKNVPYPYIQGVGRSSGWAGHPNNLMSIIGIAWLLRVVDLFQARSVNKKDVLFFGFTFLVALTTLSKMLLLYLAGIMCIYICINIKKNTIVIKSTIGALLLFYVISTHIMLADTTTTSFQSLVKSGLVTDRVIGSLGGLNFVKTNYFLTKEASILCGLEHQPWGIGVGKFVEQYLIFQQKGWFTSYMGAGFEPHCIYTGFFVESGVIGLVTLLLLIYFFTKTFQSIKINLANEQHRFLLVCKTIGFLYLIDGIVTEVIFMRYYYIFIILGICIVRKENEITKI